MQLYNYSHSRMAFLIVFDILVYTEMYECKQEVSCFDGSRAVGTLCEVVPAHCFSPAINQPPFSDVAHVGQCPVTVALWLSVCRSGDNRHHRAGRQAGRQAGKEGGRELRDESKSQMRQRDCLEGDT